MQKEIPPYERPEKPRRLTPKADWESDYFDIRKDPKGIDGRTKLSKLLNLRDYVLPPGDIEVRVWSGFSIVYLQGIVLKRTSGKWSGIRLLSAVPKYAKQEYRQVLPDPKPGWESLWKRLVREGLLTLPDSSTLKQEPEHIYGHYFSYVVEINQNKTYRTYKYGNLEHQKWPEARCMERILNLLYEAFGPEGS